MWIWMWQSSLTSCRKRLMLLGGLPPTWTPRDPCSSSCRTLTGKGLSSILMVCVCRFTWYVFAGLRTMHVPELHQNLLDFHFTMWPSAVALHHTCFISIAAQRMANFGQHACTFSAAQQQALYFCFWCQMSDACASDCWLCVVQTHMQMT